MHNTISIQSDPNGIVAGTNGSTFYRNGNRCYIIPHQTKQIEELYLGGISTFSGKKYANSPMYKNTIFMYTSPQETWTKMSSVNGPKFGWKFGSYSLPVFGDCGCYPIPSQIPVPTPTPTPTPAPIITRTVYIQTTDFGVYNIWIWNGTSRTIAGTIDIPWNEFLPIGDPYVTDVTSIFSSSPIVDQVGSVTLMISKPESLSSSGMSERSISVNSVTNPVGVYTISLLSSIPIESGFIDWVGGIDYGNVIQINDHQSFSGTLITEPTI